MIKNEVLEIKDELISIRRDIHKHPEIGFQEKRTAKVVAEYLRELGLEVQTEVAQTGVVGLLHGKGEGRTILLRADMDALPLQEKNDVEYKSVYDGVMHACGHDGHVAMLLGAAKILSAHTDDFDGCIKFMFQPGEEGYAGARDMIEEGVLENPKVDAAFALHLSPSIPIGHIAVKPGPMMASVDNFTIKIIGKSGHAAMPQFGTDAILVAAEIITSLPALITKEISPMSPIIMHVGTIHGGDAANIIAEEVVMEGTVRNLDRAAHELIPEKMERILKGITAGYNADFELDYIKEYPPLVNDDAMTDFVKGVVETQVGPEKTFEMPPMMGGEDMAFVLNKVQGSFFWVGSGNEAKGITASNHNSSFDIDEDALTIGCEALVNVALTWLNQ